MKTLIGTLFLLLLAINKPCAQPLRLESYRPLLAEKQKIKGFEKDTAYIHLLIRFANAFYSVNADSLLFYSQKAYIYMRKRSITSRARPNALGRRGIFML